MKIYGTQLTQDAREKFIALNIYQEREKCQINHQNSHLKNSENKEQNKLKTSRKKEIIKTKAEINEIKNKKSMKKDFFLFKSIKLTNLKQY